MTMQKTERFYNCWDDDDGIVCHFDITIISEPDSFDEPGYEHVAEEEYTIDGREVSYHEFTQHTGIEQSDMAHERHRHY